MLRNLLVHIPTVQSSRPVTDCAVSLAASIGARLDAVAIGYESLNAGFVAEGGGAIAAVMEVERERAVERANAAIAAFEPGAKHAEIAYGTRALSAIPAEAAEIIGSLARLYDLTIVSQPELSQPCFDNHIAQAVLFDSGGPVLMVPYIHSGAFNAGNVAIAWDGSRLAARALRDGMPFLATADNVTVVTVNEDRDAAGEASSGDLVDHLSRRGIHARIERLTAERSNIHNAILSSAADNGIDLMIMGGYGHSRLKERVLGGVTRGMFESMTIPTLMSH